MYLAAGGNSEDWLVSRAIDRHRPNSRILKKVLRLTDSSDVVAVLRAHAATITDNYWLQLEGEDALSYENAQFSEDTFVGIALIGSFSSYFKTYDKYQLSAGSPELTNIGSSEKCRRIKKRRLVALQKRKSLERFLELFIARLGREFSFSMAEYLLDGNLGKTSDFTKGIPNYEPAAALVGDEEISLISRVYGPDTHRINGFLIDLFVEFLEKRELTYQGPVLNEALVKEIAQVTLPKEDVDRNYVVNMVLERGQRIEQKTFTGKPLQPRYEVFLILQS